MITILMPRHMLSVSVTRIARVTARARDLEKPVRGSVSDFCPPSRKTSLKSSKNPALTNCGSSEGKQNGGMGGNQSQLPQLQLNRGSDDPSTPQMFGCCETRTKDRFPTRTENKTERRLCGVGMGLDSHLLATNQVRAKFPTGK
jgi:hypothetical protein